MRFKRCLIIASIITAMVIGGNVFAEELTLKDCIEKALEHHPDVQRAEGNARIAGEGVWTAVGNFLPSVGGSGTVSQTNREQGRLIPVGDEIREVGKISKNYSLSMSAQLTAFDGGRNVFDYLRARANKSYYDYIESQSRQNLVLTVKTYYFAYLASQKALEIRQEAMKRGEEQLKLAESKYEVGSASKSDVLKARVQYGNDKLGLITAENNVRTTFADLTYVIGVDVNSDVTFSTDFEAEHYEGTESDALKFAMQHQPGFLASQKDMDAAKWGVWSARGAYLPTITVRVSKNYQNEFWHEVIDFNKKDGYWNISTTVNIPIFTGFTRKSAVSRAKVTLNNSRAEFNYARNNLALQVKKAYLDMNEAREKLDVAGETLASAEEDMALVQEKYNLGAATILELLDAEVSLITAQYDKVQAEFDYNLAIAGLEKAMGLR